MLNLHSLDVNCWPDLVKRFCFWKTFLNRFCYMENVKVIWLLFLNKKYKTNLLALISFYYWLSSVQYYSSVFCFNLIFLIALLFMIFIILSCMYVWFSCLAIKMKMDQFLWNSEKVVSYQNVWNGNVNACAISI